MHQSIIEGKSEPAVIPSVSQRVTRWLQVISSYKLPYPDGVTPHDKDNVILEWHMND